MKISSQLFFRAIVTEFLENHNFTLKASPIAYVYEFDDIKVKVGIKNIHIYDMSEKNDMDKLKASVRYNEYKSLDKVRGEILSLIGAKKSSNFYLKRTDNPEMDFIAFSLTQERVHEYIDDIGHELKELDFVGYILFDLFMCNGLDSNNRFYTAFFNGENIDLNSFKNCKDVPTEILQECNFFYKNNYKLINDSALTKPQKYLFKKRTSRNHP